MKSYKKSTWTLNVEMCTFIVIVDGHFLSSSLFPHHLPSPSSLPPYPPPPLSPLPLSLPPLSPSPPHMQYTNVPSACSTPIDINSPKLPDYSECVNGSNGYPTEQVDCPNYATPLEIKDTLNSVKRVRCTCSYSCTCTLYMWSGWVYRQWWKC